MRKKRPSRLTSIVQKGSSILHSVINNQPLENVAGEQIAMSHQKTIPVDTNVDTVRFIRDSGLFDEVFYLDSYPDVKEIGIDPILDYIKQGVKESRNPNKEFDTQFYVETNPDIIEAGFNPLEHYILHGQSENRQTQAVKESIQEKNPHQETINLIKASGMFDETYYLSTYPDVKEACIDPVLHYIIQGAEEGRDPNRYFHTSFYTEANLDIIEAGFNPLEHYILHGKNEGRKASKPMTYQEAFDIEFYISRYPDIIEAGVDPFEHYSQWGWTEGRLPNKWFNSMFYLQHYSDVPDKNQDPLLHYIEIGQFEGRKTNQSLLSKRPNGILSYEEAFDLEFYLNKNPDIIEAGVNPFNHYSTWGWKEQRLANGWFDSVFYSDMYEDVEEEQDPLLHYVEIGQFEDRKYRLAIVPNLSENVKQHISRVQFDDVSEGYVDYTEHTQLDIDVKLIAFYLPQFHPFPENDEWWGKGFTEWTNVTKAKPNFTGHYQPHLPIHNGFYDLRVPEVMIEQAKLAKNYGIHGFNFYYYWFDGKVLMHKPFEILLKHKEIDINFCITWANENWTRRWDGADNDILIAQNHCEEDSIKFIEHMYQYFEDDRYIRVDNKPVLIIYRSNIIPDMAKTIELWRRKVEEAGFEGIHLIGAQTFGFRDPKEYGFDAAVEFPPHNTKSGGINHTVEITNHDYEGYIFDYGEVVDSKFDEVEPSYKCYRTTMLSWDNTARKQNNGHTFANFSMLKYKQWLFHASTEVFNNSKYKEDEKFVFVNAWNEWAEGTHLEPDRSRGYAYLEGTYDVLKQFNKQDILGLSYDKPIKKNDYAVILHVHYTDIWEDILAYLKNLDYVGFDLFVTVTNSENSIVRKIKEAYPSAYIQLVENRGRDIRPFINTYKLIKDLDYIAVCKIHSKKSAYREDGSEIRIELYEGLLGSQLESIIEEFSNDELGLICLEKYYIPHQEKNLRYNENCIDFLSDLLDIKFEVSVFPAGSMYWFRPKALKGLEKIEDYFFKPEEGLADGTIAHAVERIIVNIVNSNGYMIDSI